MDIQDLQLNAIIAFAAAGRPPKEAIREAKDLMDALRREGLLMPVPSFIGKVK